MRSVMATLMGVWVLVVHPTKDERGLSQSTETAILIAGVVVIAGGIVVAITGFVQSRMP